MYVNLSKLPSPPKKYQVALGSLYGGLNTAKLPSEIGSSQCPELLNMLWRDGVLRSRKGQEILQGQIQAEGNNAFDFRSLTMYEKVWHDRLIFCFYKHSDSKTFIYEYDLTKKEYREIYSEDFHGPYGSFFAFGDKLYYKQKDLYVEIEYYEGSNETESYVEAKKVEGYIPIVMINAKQLDTFLEAMAA